MLQVRIRARMDNDQGTWLLSSTHRQGQKLFTRPCNSTLTDTVIVHTTSAWNSWKGIQACEMFDSHVTKSQNARQLHWHGTF